MQIATRFKRQTIANESLCLHTLRADCNEIPSYSDVFGEDFASTRSVQIATPRLTRAGSGTGPLPPHAPCRLQQGRQLAGAACQTLPPHAPCRLQPRLHSTATKSRPLPPHAPCRLQRGCHPRAARPGGFASTRSVQIATRSSVSSIHWQQSFASTRSVQIATRCPSSRSTGTSLPPHAPCRLQLMQYFEENGRSVFASTRSVQIATRQLSAALQPN